MNDCHPTEEIQETHCRYWVQCENSLYMGVVDKCGKWTSFSNDKDLPRVISFVSIQRINQDNPPRPVREMNGTTPVA